MLYVINYAIGWMLYAGKIKMRKRQHQLLYVSVIVLLIALIPFIADEPGTLILVSFSIVMMVILPFGKKGSMYHIVVSSAGLLAYVMLFIV
jgi:hypothetical protein